MMILRLYFLETGKGPVTENKYTVEKHVTQNGRQLKAPWAPFVFQIATKACKMAQPRGVQEDIFIPHFFKIDQNNGMGGVVQEARRPLGIKETTIVPPQNESFQVIRPLLWRRHCEADFALSHSMTSARKVKDPVHHIWIREQDKKTSSVRARLTTLFQAVVLSPCAV